MSDNYFNSFDTLNKIEAVEVFDLKLKNDSQIMDCNVLLSFYFSGNVPAIYLSESSPIDEDEYNNDYAELDNAMYSKYILKNLIDLLNPCKWYQVNVIEINTETNFLNNKN